MSYPSLPKPFFVLAPMDDVTDTVFRQIVAEAAAPDLFFTEFVNVDGLQSPGRPRLLPKLQFTKKETPLIAQVWGKKPENYYKTVKEIVDGTLAHEANNAMQREDGDAEQGRSEARSDAYMAIRKASTEASDAAMRSKLSQADSSAERQVKAIPNFAGVDINMGCPVKKVVKDGCCSALILDRGLAGEIIQATKDAAGDFPLSVKTRLGYKEVDMSWIEFLLQQKLNMLTIHCRTVKQMSKVPAQWEYMKEIKRMRDELSPTTLLVINGDIKNRQHGEELVKKYGLDGAMIGRGIFHDPYAFAKKSLWQDLTDTQKKELYTKHVKLFAKTWKNNQRKVQTLNKFCKIYINDFPGASELRDKLMHAHDIEELLKLLKI